MMVLKVLFFVLSVAALADGFTPISPLKKNTNSLPLQGNRPQFHKPSQPLSPSRKDTSLSALLELPEYFFTFTFPLLGIILSISNRFGRLRMEERAWEQRVEEARAKRLQEDPTLTEIELRRNEAALEWSAYGKPRMQEERAERERQERESRSRVKVMDLRDRDEDEDFDDREYRMTDEEVSMFEMEYGVEYDPYYDDAYSEEELPEDIPYNVYKKYGDRVYDNGEIFYKDKESGLYYRQGAKPRNLSFWG
jgi:hypothetical protein